MKAFRLFEAVAAMLALILAGHSILLSLKLSASSRLLASIQSITPGENIHDIRMRFGHEMMSISDPDEMIAFGSIKDPVFCSDKNLYWFTSVRLREGIV
jgi:hypothetical protein